MNDNQKQIARALLAIYTQHGGIAASVDKEVYMLAGMLPTDVGLAIVQAIKPRGNKYQIGELTADRMREEYGL